MSIQITKQQYKDVRQRFKQARVSALTGELVAPLVIPEMDATFPPQTHTDAIYAAVYAAINLPETRDYAMRYPLRRTLVRRAKMEPHEVVYDDAYLYSRSLAVHKAWLQTSNSQHDLQTWRNLARQAYITGYHENKSATELLINTTPDHE